MKKNGRKRSIPERCADGIVGGVLGIGIGIVSGVLVGFIDGFVCGKSWDINIRRKPAESTEDKEMK